MYCAFNTRALEGNRAAFIVLGPSRGSKLPLPEIQHDINVGLSRPSRVNNSSTDFDNCSVSQIIRDLSDRPCLIREGLGRHSLDRGTSQFPWISWRGARRPTSIGAARGKIGRSLAFQCQKTIDGRRCRVPKSPRQEAGASSGAVVYIWPVQDVHATLINDRGESGRSESKTEKYEYFDVYLRPPPISLIESHIRLNF